MGRIMAIDYGTKRCGIAVTDPLQLTANGLDTLHPDELLPFLSNYLQQEEVDTLVIGEPKRFSGEASKVESEIVGFIRKVKKQFPTLPLAREDERFTSKEAAKTLIAAGIKKNKRKDKALIDKVSATLILQSYLENNQTP